MLFTKHCKELNNFHAALKTIEHPSHLQISVLDGIDNIIQNCQLFDACISCDSPFIKVFFTRIQSQNFNNTDTETCFELFECLCILFREKRLRLGYSKLTKPEKNLLDYFENSGHWEQSENTAIGIWYWNILPQKIINEALGS